MKILFVSQYFYPELFRGNDIAFFLSESGHDVTVITGIPNYPHGKYFNGYGLFKRRKETLNGVKIIRIPLFPRGKGTGIQLFMNLLSFASFGSVFSFLHSFRNKYDKVFVQQLSPVTMSLPGIIVSKIQKIPLYIWVLDLWPESLSSAGGTNNQIILKFFNIFVNLQYRTSKKILISSKGFKELIIKKGVSPSKILYFPNWAESVKNNNKLSIPNLPNGFLIMFAGNIGEAQDFENIMKATKILSYEKSIHFVFLGTGRKKEWASKFVIDNKLNDTVHFLGHFPQDYMPVFFENASLMLLTLKDKIIFNVTAPAKLQAYMSFGKPIVAMINGDGAQIIQEANCGISVRAGDSGALASTILQMKNMPRDELIQLGKNGYRYCVTHFNKSKCLAELLKIMSLN